MMAAGLRALTPLQLFGDVLDSVDHAVRPALEIMRAEFQFPAASQIGKINPNALIRFVRANLAKDAGQILSRPCRPSSPARECGPARPLAAPEIVFLEYLGQQS